MTVTVTEYTDGTVTEYTDGTVTEYTDGTIRWHPPTQPFSFLHKKRVNREYIEVTPGKYTILYY